MSFINAVLSQGAGVVSAGALGEGGLGVGLGCSYFSELSEDVHLVLSPQLSLAGKPGFQTPSEIRIPHARHPASH